MPGKKWRKLKLYLSCNSLPAAKMVDASPACAAWLPCRIALVEDDAGKLWICALNMNMMIHGGLPLEPAFLEEALHVKEAIQTIMREAAEGACRATPPADHTHGDRSGMTCARRAAIFIGAVAAASLATLASVPRR